MIRASAPGSVMITGEHAVVYGSRAIVAAIEQRLTVTLRPRTDQLVRLSSEIAETQTVDLDQLQAVGPYKFVLAAIAMHRDAIDVGMDISISSEIDPTLGLGSSAAVTIAAPGAVLTITGQPLNGIHSKAYQIIQDIQGRGSGADLAASLQGGMLAYRTPPNPEMVALPHPPTIGLRYCGYKTPTSVVLQKVAERMIGREAEFKSLYADMGDLADHAISAAKDRDWVAFANTLTSYQARMEDLGVSDETLNRIITSARQAEGVMAAKISGSGLGDCVLALGAPLTSDIFSYKSLILLCLGCQKALHGLFSPAIVSEC